ncbi:MAG: hypothetical protein V3S40_02725 [Kiloniellales bacterium]
MWLSSGAVAATETPESPSRVVARVFEAEIRLGDISPPEVVQSKTRERMSEADYEAWLHDFRKDRLADRIWREATGRLVDEQGLEPTAAEVDAFISSSEATRAGRLDEFRAHREETRKKLAKSDLPASERARLEQDLETFEKAIAHELEERRKSETLPNYDAMRRRSGERVGKIMIRQWKVNQALYVKYGGRVIFQQAGFEPVDAYRAFSAELEERNAVVILDPSFPAPFSRLREYLDMPHQYMPKEEAERYFEKPWWLVRQ